ncbi:unnamed protein product [Rotaria sp. Silwood2]|nr:unnamed protein product [Rotaria sp. Silwood2]CAF2552641.1 unnamed protein product [Rotaria sp. Silwood2]CAF2773661.1 unnamed protein product [Rotaria sp. Silwood2]CAF2948957.1 unnamed protein product [Rotaria sp. Silwood2]CAF3882809.1 unnamed protein product [Rotaria sp. Silwood2]
MASMNYCFTICRAAEEKVQQQNHSNASSAIDVPNSSSPNTGAYFFGRFFSFGLSPPASTSTIDNSFVFKTTNLNEINDNS